MAFPEFKGQSGDGATDRRAPFLFASPRRGRHSEARLLGLTPMPHDVAPLWGLEEDAHGRFFPGAHAPGYSMPPPLGG